MGCIHVEKGVNPLVPHVQYELLRIRNGDRSHSGKDPGTACYASMLPVLVFVQLLSALGCQRSGLGVERANSYFRRVHVYKLLKLRHVETCQLAQPDRQCIKRRTMFSYP